jgi:hypothetical protein
MTMIPTLFAALPFWVGAAVLFVLLWLGRLVIDVVAKDVIKAQGGDALAQRINRDLTLFRTGLKAEKTPPRPSAFYFGNAIGFLIPCAATFNKVVFFSVGEPYTAILNVFSLVLWPFLYPIVSRHWRALPEHWFLSGVMMSLCVSLAGAPFILIPAFVVEHIVY